MRGEFPDVKAQYISYEERAANMEDICFDSTNKILMEENGTRPFLLAMPSFTNIEQRPGVRKLFTTLQQRKGFRRFYVHMHPTRVTWTLVTDMFVSCGEASA